MRGLFITGTDTGVGKTVVAAALLHRYRNRVPLCYWKPVQTGIEQSDDTRTVCELGGCSAAEIFDQGVRLPLPLSPHVSARISGGKIDLDQLAQAIDAMPAGAARLVEGAGGVLVPINENRTMADLMYRLGLPVLVVARAGLGTINHTLMTLEALRRRSLRVAGVVMAGEKNTANREAIEGFGAIEVLGELPPLPTLSTESLAAWARADLDPRGRLLEFLI